MSSVEKYDRFNGLQLYTCYWKDKPVTSVSRSWFCANHTFFVNKSFNRTHDTIAMPLLLDNILANLVWTLTDVQKV